MIGFILFSKNISSLGAWGLGEPAYKVKKLAAYTTPSKIFQKQTHSPEESNGGLADSNCRFPEFFIVSPFGR